MLNQIKCSYLKKIIFYYLNEKVKLKLVKYNKKLQDLIGISLHNYRILIEKYIIYEEGHNAKIYDGIFSSLLFEGKIIKGQKWKRKRI